MRHRFLDILEDRPVRPEHEVDAAATETAARFGFHVIETDEIDVSWDGKGRLLIPKDRFAELVAHEISHFQLAAPHRRHRPEFGLGTGYATTDKNVRQLVSDSWAYREELVASMLGLLWLRSWGGDVQSEAEELDLALEMSDGWIEVVRDEDPVTPDQSLAYLVAEGFADADTLVPIPKLRTGRMAFRQDIVPEMEPETPTFRP
jgi:hypothetical protein